MGTNPILGILAGILVTAVIQSSTASIGILQSLAIAGMVPWNAAVYIVLGQNVGTCLTAVLSAIGATKNAKAASYVHLVYNVIGAIIFCAVGIIYFTFIDPKLGQESITATNISMVHTGYNVAALILLFPFGRLILKIAEKMTNIGRHGSESDGSDMLELDESILETPSYALENSIKAICKLMELMRRNFVLGVTLFTEKDYKKIGKFKLNAEEIDKVNDKINAFLTKLYHENINDDENSLTAVLIHITISLKRISNHTKGFAQLTNDLHENGINDKYDGAEKLTELYEKTLHCFDIMEESFKTGDKETINLTMHETDIVESLREKFKIEHLNLASSPGYSVELGIAYSEAARHFARIAHNIKSVVETIPHGEEEAEQLNEIFDRR